MVVSEEDKNLIWATKLDFTLLDWFILSMSHNLQMVDFYSITLPLGVKKRRKKGKSRFELSHFNHSIDSS
jgi:hypothetical protein